MLSVDQARRIKNFCAHNSRRTDEILRTFEVRFSRALPAIGGLVAIRSKRARYELAAHLAEIIKHVDRLDVVSARLGAAGDRLRAAGFGSAHAAAFRGAVLSALRRDAVGNWHARTGEDWEDALDLIMERMGFGQSSAACMPMRAAA